MLATDLNKTLHWSPNTFLSPAQSAPFAGFRGMGDYFTEGKLQQGLRGLRGYQVFAYAPEISSGLGGYGVFNYDPALMPGLGWVAKKAPALGDCGCGCGGNGSCLGDDSFSSSLGFTMPDDLGGGDFDISDLMPSPGETRGSGITDTMAMIAQFDPEPVSRTALTIAASAKNFVTGVENFFHIGAGRRTADQIVPTQNDIQHNVLEPAYAEMGQGQALNCASISTMYLSVFKSWQRWLHFLHDTHWIDPRAPQQAEATLAPYFNTILGSNGGAPGQYEKGGFEQIFEAKNCGTWVPTATQPGTGATPPVITPSTGPVTGPIYAGGVLSAQSIRQILPYALIGGAVYAISKVI